MISRSLGPEFGGSIGLMFFLAKVCACGEYVLGLVEAILDVFGSDPGMLRLGVCAPLFLFHLFVTVSWVCSFFLFVCCVNMRETFITLDGIEAFPLVS